MNIKLTNPRPSRGLFALTSFVAQPVLADEWNKKNGIPIHRASTDSRQEPWPRASTYSSLPTADSDRNIVQIFSEDSDGNQSLIAMLMAVPDYIEQRPDKPVGPF